MDKLKVCFVGVGSIAKRHIRNLSSICSECGVSLQIDAFRRQNEVIEGVSVVYTSISEVPCDYDVIFITNPTECHLEALSRFHEKGRHFFIEKPVVSLSQIENARIFQLRDNAVYYVACPLRYNAVIQWIRNNVRPSDVMAVRSISSSYLPDWRPGQDYRDTYSAHKELGGGVSIDLIHEWDYLTYLFGWPETVFSLIGKKSDLEIDSDDYAIYIADYKDKTIELHVDYYGRKSIREIQLFTKDNTIIGDLKKNTIDFINADQQIVFNEDRDDYQKRELIHFLDIIAGKSKPEDGFHHGLEVLLLTQGRLVK